VYIADTVALAQLELLVHVSRRRLVTMDLGVARVEFDERLVTNVADKDMPDDWQQSLWPASTQELGNRWIQEGTLPVLRVPSSVSPTDFNFLLNPHHTDFHKVVVHPFRPFTFTSRLLNDV
jgi:RES domain-containing protein